MVKLTLILPALLPLITFASAKHKHAEVHVKAWPEDKCERNHPGSHKVSRHEISNDGECERSWHYPFKSFRADYDYDRPWNPHKLDCFIDLYDDDDCKVMVGSQRVYNIREDCVSVNNSNIHTTAVAAKLNCRDGKSTPLETRTSTIQSIVTQIVGPSSSSTAPPSSSTVETLYKLSGGAVKTVTTRVPSTSTVVCKPTTYTSIWTSCYVPSFKTSATVLTHTNYTAVPAISVTTSTSTWLVQVPTTTATTSSSVWTIW